jgi:hypothetical protein
LSYQNFLKLGHAQIDPPWHLLASPGDFRGAGTKDKSSYPASGEAFGAVKILDDSFQVVSEKGPDELSPWAHSSLRGKAFATWTLQK